MLDRKKLRYIHKVVISIATVAFLRKKIHDFLMKPRKFVYVDGTVKHETLFGLYHREDGPAILEASGTEVWFINDELHRPDGPAIVYKDDRPNLWYWHDVELPLNKWLDANDQLSEEEKTLFKLKWG